MLLSCGMMFSQNEFEYVYDGIDVYNQSDVINFSDIFEMDNGDFVVFGKNRGIYFGCFSENGELLSETSMSDDILGYQSFSYEATQIIRDKNDNFYVFIAYNPILDTTNAGYQGFFDSKIVMNKLNEEFEVIYSKEITVPLDTTNWINIWADPQPSYESPEIQIGTVLDSGDGFVICYEKYAGHITEFEHPVTGYDSTLFIKTDYELNVHKSGSFGHSNCNKMRHRNHMIYDEADDEYLYYVSSAWFPCLKKGFYLYRFDSDFNYIGEHYLANTNGHGMHTIKYSDHNSGAEGITLKRTSSNTTIMMAGARCCHYPDEYTAAVCLVMNDEAKMLDSITFGRAEMSPGNRTTVPSACSIDWVDENRIFIGATPNSFFIDLLYSNEYQYLVIKMIDKDLNILDERYYDFGETSALWTTTLKATNDGGCMIAGHFKDFGKDPDEDIYYNFIKKFPPEAFVGIEEAHINDLKVAVAYPNPGVDIMNIRTTLRDCNLTVYDMQGRIVHQQEITDDVTSIDASKWTNGTYVWKLGMRNEKLGMKEVESGKWIKGN